MPRSLPMMSGELAMRYKVCVLTLALFACAGWSQVSPKKRVVVFDFDNAAIQSAIASRDFLTTPPDVGKSVSELLITKLVKDGKVSVVERSAIDKVLAEQNFSNSDRADPVTAAKLGRILGADAIILGAITHYEYGEKLKKGHSIFSVSASPKAKYDISAKIQISTRLVSPNTSEVLAVSQGVGETVRKGVKVDLRDQGGRLLMASGVNSSVMNESLDKAIAQLTTQLEPELAKLPPRVPVIDGLVADANESGRLVLNVGARDGVKVGDRLQILRLGKEVRDPVTGKLLLRDDTLLGEAVVTRVNDNSSIAQYQGSAPAKVSDLVKGGPK